MTIRQKAKDNPLMAGLISLSTIVGAFLVISQGVTLIDASVMSESEARVIHAAIDAKFASVGEKLDTQAILNECRWIDDKIDGLEYEIYILKRDQASADFIRSKESTLRKHRDKYLALHCVSKL